MKLSKDKQVEQGKALARGMRQEQTRHKNERAKAVQQRVRSLEQAAEKELFT